MDNERAAGTTASSMTPERVTETLNGPPSTAVLDVREPMDYADGHVPGSTLVPRRALERRLPELVPNRKTRVVLVATTDERGARTAAWLARLGWQSAAYLKGGMGAWNAAGLEAVAATDGIYASAFNVPSKAFGERVAVERDPPTVSPDRLAEWLAADDDVTVVDVRTPGEYRNGTLPTAVNVEGVDLPAFAKRARDVNEKLVVHCAGRTRSIVNAATLAKRGVENVYGLENGTSGWKLAGYELETDADRRIRADELADSAGDVERAFAERLLREGDVERLSVEAFADRRVTDEGTTYPVDEETLYPIDVRTVVEYANGHVPGTLGIPGGQAIQRADDYVAVPDADLVFISRSMVRAAITAYWFVEMGFENVTVLDGGIDAWTDDGRPLETGSCWEETRGLSRAVERQRSCRPLPAWLSVRESVDFRSPSDISLAGLDSELETDGDTDVVHVGRSEEYRDAHLPGSRWVSRNELDSAVSNAVSRLLLTCPDGVVSTYAAAVLCADGNRGAGGEADGAVGELDAAVGETEVAVLDGGINAWTDAGRPVASGDDGLPTNPPDAVPSTSDQGAEQMRGYLEWEKQLGRTDGR